jgi:hypothetical protein
LIYNETTYPRAYYFTFENNQLAKLVEMINQDKYSLEICNMNGIPQIKLQPS